MNEAIEKLYTVFSKYTSANMQHCDCGCIDPVEVKKLMSKPLRELSEDDFASYHGSAMNTWGELEHYKHFLPRILEVHYQKKGKGIIGLYEINSKLADAHWESWEENEILVIKEFIRSNWLSFISEESTEMTLKDIEYYTFFLPLKELLALWEITKNATHLLSFVHFFYTYGNEILDKGLKINGQDYTTVFFTFFQKESLINTLENAFFANSSSNHSYSEKISAVLQLIEQSHKS